MKRFLSPSLCAFFLLAATVAWAETHFLDLSKAANRGLDESFDGAYAGIEDEKQKQGLSHLPTGIQNFRGVPFKIINPASNNGRSFIALKGRRKPDFPEALYLFAGGVRAGWVYFLHTCRWGGTGPDVTVAEYNVVYDDGQVAVIPLRVGVEFSNFWGANDTSASYLAWWHKYKNADMGLSLFPWKNPRPGEPIKSILFKSRGRMPVPLLFAVTMSDSQLPVSPASPKPEKTLKTDTATWTAFEPSDSPVTGTAIDMSFLLDAPAGKHGSVKTDVGQFLFEDGTPAKFWGVRLPKDFSNWPREKREAAAEMMATRGCNLAVLDRPYPRGGARKLEAWAEPLKTKGIYLLLEGGRSKNAPGGEEIEPPGGKDEAEGKTDEAEEKDSKTPTQDPCLIDPDVLVWGTAGGEAPAVSKDGPVTFQNAPMVTRLEGNPLMDLVRQRLFGRPFFAQWDFAWPNEYLLEAPLLYSACAGLQWWPAVAGGEINGGGWEEALSFGSSLNNKPMLLAQWPVAALIYLRGDLKQGKVYVVGQEGASKETKETEVLKALAHCAGITGEGSRTRTDASGTLKAKIQVKQKSFVSDTGQINWQANVGVVKIETVKSQALIGFLGNRKFNNMVWSVETSNPFASISLVSLSNKAVVVSNHLLLTGVARMENQGQVYNASKTKLLSPGTGPILVEPLKAKFALYRYNPDPALKVRALDANGQPLKKKVAYRWVKNSLVFSWVPSAFYLEIYK